MTSDELSAILAKHAAWTRYEFCGERADLERADLERADLERANLEGAYLEGAYLEGALGVPKERTTPLMMLLDQPGVIHAYKLVTADLTGPYHAGITYTIGAEIAVEDADTDDAVHCGAGISVATLDWCLTHWQPARGHRHHRWIEP